MGCIGSCRCSAWKGFSAKSLGMESWLHIWPNAMTRLAMPSSSEAKHLGDSPRGQEFRPHETPCEKDFGFASKARKTSQLRVGNFASQDLDIFLHICCGSIVENCGDCYFPRGINNEYCGDLRRRRIRAKAAQRIIKIQAREIPLAPKRGKSGRTGPPRRSGGWRLDLRRGAAADRPDSVRRGGAGPIRRLRIWISGGSTQASF